MESIIVAILASSSVTAVITWVLGRRKRTREDATESIELSEKVKSLIEERVKEADMLRKAESARHAAEFSEKLVAKQLEAANETLERVWKEIGKAEERESQCSERLTKLEVRVKALAELEVANRRQASEILQLRAKLENCEGETGTKLAGDDR